MIKELQLDGFKLSYTSEGEGSDVLLLHGFPSNMFFWNNIKNDLLSNYRAVSYTHLTLPTNREV